MHSSTHNFGSYLWLLLGVFACSTAVILIKASETPATLLAGWRLVLAALVLAPVFLRDFARHRDRFRWRDCAASLVPGILLGLHFASWNVGARLTPAANASLIVNLTPVIMPLVVYLMLREILTRREGWATTLAMAGMLVLGIGDFHFEPEWLLGDLVCFGSMILFTVYLVFGRRRKAPTLWLYLVPLYAFGGVFTLLLGVAVHGSWGILAWREVAIILGLTLIPTIIGHSILNRSMKALRPQVVALFNLGQFIFAGVMAYIFFAELPGPALYAAAFVLTAAVWLAVMPAGRLPWSK